MYIWCVSNQFIKKYLLHNIGYWYDEDLGKSVLQYHYNEFGLSKRKDENKNNFCLQ